MALIYCSRQFLNEESSDTPSVIVNSISEYEHVNILITDCSRKIELHGYLTDENTAKKVNILIDELTALRDAMNTARKLKKVLDRFYTTRQLAEKALTDLTEEIGFYPSKKTIVARKLKKGYKLFVSKKLRPSLFAAG